MAAVRLENAPRRSAPVVWENDAPIGEHGLLEVILRHGSSMEILFKIVPDALRALLVEHQLFAKGRRQRLLGEVVAGGAQAPGGDDDVRPAFCDVHRPAQPLRVVSDHRLVVDVHP